MTTNMQTLFPYFLGVQVAPFPPASPVRGADPFAAMPSGDSCFHLTSALQVAPSLSNQILGARRLGRAPLTKIDEPDTDRVLRRAPGLEHPGKKFADPKPSGDIRYVDPRDIRGQTIREPRGGEIPFMEMGNRYVTVGGQKLVEHYVERGSKNDAGRDDRQADSGGESCFTPEEIAVLETGELISRAIEYHREGYRRTRASTGSRKMRERAAVVKSRHEKIFTLLERGDDVFPPEKKSGLLKLIHGSNASERSAISEIIDGLSRVLSPDDVAKLIGHIDRILAHGADKSSAEPIGKTGPCGDAGEAAEEFSRALGAGEIDFAVTNFARLLLPNAHAAVRTTRILTEDDMPIIKSEYEKTAKEKGIEQFLRDFSYLFALARQTSLIAALGKHVHEVSAHASRLADAMDRLRFPIPLQQNLSDGTDYGSRDHAFGIRRALPHGMLILWRTEFEALLDELKAIEADARLHHSSLNFPVVVAVKHDPNRQGKIDLSAEDGARIYVPESSRAEAEKFVAERGLSDRVKIIEFLPPYGSYLEDAKDKHIETGYALHKELAELRLGEIDRVLDRLERGVAVADEGYPKRRVDLTRDIHRRREHWITEAVRNIASSAEKKKGGEGGSRPVDHFLVFMRNPQIPMEVKAALRDMVNFLEPNSGEIIPKLVNGLPTDESVPDYRAKLRAHCQLILEAYFRHYPWAFEIMVEDAIRRAGHSGIYRKIVPNAPSAPYDGHIDRFACMAEKIALVPREKVHQFISAVSKMPGHEDEGLQARRWERFAGLNPAYDRTVFDIIERTEWTPYVQQLHSLQHVVDSRKGFADDEEARYMAVIAAAGASYTPPVNRAAERLEKELMRAAGADLSRQWEISDLLPRLKYKLSQIASQEDVSHALGSVASAIRSWRRAAIETNSSDQYGRDIAAASNPENLHAMLKELTLVVGRSEKIAGLLQNLLARDAKNLGAMQHLLLAVYAKCALRLGDGCLERILQREQSFYDRQRASGKIKNGRTLQRALLEELKAHYRASDLANEAEERVAGEFALREDVAGIEFIPEAGFVVPDLRVALNNGSAFLVETKTLVHDGRGFANLLSRLDIVLRKACHQISTQQGKTGEKGGRIVVFIYDIADIPIGEPERAELKSRADEAQRANGEVIASVEIRVVSG